nr:MAG TPA: virion morphogenesis protein [Caudoviricetes sp.]
MSIKKKGSLDQALNRLLTRNDQYVKAGVMAGSKYPDGTNVATVAYKNEYSWKNTPSRAFIRTTVKEQKENWAKLAQQGAKAGYSIEKILGLVGTQMQGDIQYSIMTWELPPNAPATIAKKGFSAPLRDTMLMHDSFTYEIVEGKL